MRPLQELRKKYVCLISAYCQYSIDPNLLHLHYGSNFYMQVVEDFASENVVYVELRTTPKVNKGSQSLIFFVCLSP